MTRLIAIVLTLVTGAVVARADPQADIAAIRGLDAKWVEAIAAKDVDWIAGLYAPDGQLMAPGAPASVGREAIRAAWTAMVAGPGPALTFEPNQIHLSSGFDHAYDIGTWKVGDTDDGKYVVVWKKHGSEWKVVADIFNSNRAPGGAPPAP